MGIPSANCEGTVNYKLQVNLHLLPFLYCKYHIVFAPKYRRKEFYGAKRADIGKMIRDLCKWKEVNLLEGEVCPDHVHILVEIPPKLSISSFMGFLKGKTSLMIFQKYGNMKFKYRSRNFWCRGYYVDTAGKDSKKIQKYIQDQLKEDQMSEQLSLDLGDPFKGSE
jgi:putative transposase